MPRIVAVVFFLCSICSVVFGDADLWRVHELTFQAEKNVENPFTDVRLHCTFRGPDDAEYRITGFYDGDKTWKVRFCPTVPGQWTWKTECNRTDSGLHNREGRLVVKKSDGKTQNLLYRHGGLLKVSEDRRYLTYTDGTPFFWLGDTWWFCPTPLMPLDGSSKPGCDSTFRTLIEKRKKQGFNIVHWVAMTRNEVGGENEGSDYNCDYLSFIKTKHGGDFDIEKWRLYDRYVETANAAGIIPVIGFAFHIGLDPYSLEELEYLWDYAIARYGAHAVSWLICGEYNRRHGNVAERIPKVLKLGAFIKQRDPYRRAMSVHPWAYSVETRDAWNADWCDFIMLQGAHVGHGKVRTAEMYRTAAKVGKPILESETQYEDIYGGSGKSVDTDDVRLSAWHALQWGSFGYTYGAHGLWYPKQDENDKTYSKKWGDMKPWWVAMDFPGAEQLAYLKNFYETVNWTKFRPRPDLLKLDESAYTDPTRPMLQLDEAAGTVIVYFPKNSGKDRTVETRLAPAAYKAEWFNPRTGERSAATLDASSSRLPDRPDAADWTLTLMKMP